MTATTAWLSQFDMTCLPAPDCCCNYSGRSFFTLICLPMDCLSHWTTCGHTTPHTPTSHKPDASDVTTAGWCRFSSIMSVAQFQSDVIVFHHNRSGQNSWLRQIRWNGCLAMPSNTIALLRNDRPGWITLHTCCNVLIRDSKSLQVHDLQCNHSVTALKF